MRTRLSFCRPLVDNGTKLQERKTAQAERPVVSLAFAGLANVLPSRQEQGTVADAAKLRPSDFHPPPHPTEKSLCFFFPIDRRRIRNFPFHAL
jgi:hypothetical protein